MGLAARVPPLQQRGGACQQEKQFEQVGLAVCSSWAPRASLQDNIWQPWCRCLPCQPNRDLFECAAMSLATTRAGVCKTTLPAPLCWHTVRSVCIFDVWALSDHSNDPCSGDRVWRHMGTVGHENRATFGYGFSGSSDSVAGNRSSKITACSLAMCAAGTSAC